MKRFRVRYRPEALADLEDVYRYICRISSSPDIARRVVERIRARCRTIGDAPFGGAPRDDLMSGLRTVPFEGRAVIAYLVETDNVRITNVFYGGRNFEALYRGSPTMGDDDGIDRL